MEKLITLKNETGLHARPAALLAKKASSYNESIELEYKGKKVNAKSVLSIMSLGIGKDSEVKVITNSEGSLIDICDFLENLEGM